MRMRSPITVDGPRQDVPEGWRLEQLATICGQARNTDPAMRPDEPFQYVDISSVDNQRKTITTPKTLVGRDAPSRARQLIHTDDILVATTRPYLNAVARVPAELDGQVCSTGFCVLRSGSDVDPGYLFAFVQSRDFVVSLSALVNGALYPAVTDSQVREQWLPLAPLHEQRRIAAILRERMTAVDRARAAAEAQLEAARALPAAYLRAVFESDEARGWPMSRVSEVASVVDPNPSHRYPEYVDSGVPMISTSEFVGKDDVDLSRAPRVPETFFDETLGRYGVGEGDIIFARKGKIGYARPYPARQQVAMTHTLCVLQPDSRHIVDRFLLYFARSATFLGYLMETMNPNNGVPTLGLDVIRGAPTPLPPLARQRQIVSRLDAYVDSLVCLCVSLTDQLDAINHLPAALLRQAFTGEL